MKIGSGVFKKSQNCDLESHQKLVELMKRLRVYTLEFKA